MANFSFYTPLDKGPTCYQNSVAHGLYLGRSSASHYLSGNSRENIEGTSGSRSSLISSDSSSSIGSIIGTGNGNFRSESVLSSPTSNKAIISNQVQLRFLNPGDYETVKALCEEWFPVEYPAKWFEAITSDTNLFSLAAVLDGKIVGTD